MFEAKFQKWPSVLLEFSIVSLWRSAHVMLTRMTYIFLLPDFGRKYA